ncbi:hypothetical protein PHLGIDRAFT_69188 [Phlebiopsis gigantea 11061_1 CR5-6]|uniref:Dienelactone hydrolase domain-containing protein n=1 Tax=Phlebiopsis gigantea (strain 11061_1 CR5-6) TaxID=745531 RepID=A0A0C3SC56_PHLG1|nr:hypothetical protein PHLGIDRAFT_69188 [Phlebiopsis gigantea 11061_1 CR5-6]
MSTTTHNTNKACCTIPPVKSDYQPKGTFKSYAGFNRVYVAGPEKPGKLALVCVFDIFGYKPQTQQGADILAENLNAQVLLPDFFEGDEPWPLEKFPPTTPEDQKKLQEWFGGFANPANHVPNMLSADDAAKLEIPFGCYISNDEPVDEFDKIKEILAKKPLADKNDFKHFDSFHGWAAARANLDDPDNKAKYEELYCDLINFTKKNSGLA